MTEKVLNALREVVGEKNLLAGSDDRRAYDNDVIGKHEGHSWAVAQPATTTEVSEILKLAHLHGIPVVPQGGNTGLAGGASPGAGANQIILSLARMNKITEINADTRIARVEAGVVLEKLHNAAAEHDLIFPLFFGARGSCMIGGNLSTNAGGSNVLRYGNTRALVLGVEVVLADGRVLNLMSELLKDNTGYDLKDLFIGAEGTLGVITGAVLKLFPRPSAYATAYLAMGNMADALSLLRSLQDLTGNAVEAFEYMPAGYFKDYVKKYPDCRAPLENPDKVNILVEVGASSALLARPDSSGRAAVHGVLEETLAKLVEEGKISDAVVAQTDAQRLAFWHCRESAFELSTMYGPMIDHDISVPLGKVDTFLREMRRRLPEIAPEARDCVIAHLGDGNLHYSVVPAENHDGIDPALAENVTSLVEDVIAELNGSFSAEHGIGLSKRPSMARRKDRPALDVMKEIKHALDPKNIMNPGKVLP
ncbi:FAD-binding oxidoreductase [Pseudohalocynthiibacter sp. F2068]|jgi:FAD/FMN-containing dehydrogenase|uniref:FAD-binding oxidoreductase n=1 Tax=Pseudohalocynthiibacter sp. F2068 TaxID=2926418 RepID=UPI001FF22879|nr:FAD-binding oxidoreductase [Pseudohalocynthiibacter sp. F2068]MCK0103009.1 FAD-binding oxidoreductase [Pseudohalocynthiibacter sp. F2068]